ncbi:hypothetical protein VNO78_08039 [Psophocarpus tetragonolobus]|uniref:Uncharacterized protein n=1 Tax=Psophocarpus tetragonolobus TaxID=3891 RepID=A0AAN9SX56_PSOTE
MVGCCLLEKSLPVDYFTCSLVEKENSCTSDKTWKMLIEAGFEASLDSQQNVVIISGWRKWQEWLSCIAHQLLSPQ